MLGLLRSRGLLGLLKLLGLLGLGPRLLLRLGLLGLLRSMKSPGRCCPRDGAPPWNTRRCVEHPTKHGTFADMWNIRRGVEHCGAHQGRFHSPRRFSEARVRRKGPGAHGESTFFSQLRQLTLSDSVRGTPALPYQNHHLNRFVRETPSRRTEFEDPLFHPTRKPLVLSSPLDYLSKRNYMTSGPPRPCRALR